MTNVIPSIFEDGYLKEFSDGINMLSSASTNDEVDQAVASGFSALEKVPDASVRENAKRRLRMMEQMAKQRVSK